MSFILIAAKDTFLKLGETIETEQSSELPPEKIQSVDKGEDLGIEEILEEKDDHAFCKLQAAAGLRTLYKPDWEGWPEEVNSEQLIVNSEQLIVNSEQLIVNSEQLIVNSEQLIVNGEQLRRVPTLGASSETAKQDGLRVAGVAASHAMARTDWPRLEKFLDRFKTVAAKFKIPAAILLSLASRESRGGNVLQNGWGDRGNAWGWLQVDKRYHKLQGLDHPCSIGHLEQAAAIWVDYYGQIKNKFPSWEVEYHIKGAFCAYNAGVSVVNTKSAMNRGTTGNDYGDDCAARAQYYLSILKNDAVASSPVVTVPAASKLPQGTLLEKAITYMKEQKYIIWDEPGQVNIIYIEGMNENGLLNADEPNKFNDLRIVFNSEKLLGIWAATTEPGFRWTANPMNPKGAARIQFNQFDAWRVGIHKDHEALVQVKPVTVHRDFDKNYIRTGDRLDTGLFGINQHHGWNAAANNVGGTSAGCLVVASVAEHQAFMRIVKNDPRYKANKNFVFTTAILPGDKLN